MNARFTLWIFILAFAALLMGSAVVFTPYVKAHEMSEEGIQVTLDTQRPVPWPTSLVTPLELGTS